MLGKDFAGEAAVLWVDGIGFPTGHKKDAFFTFRMLALNVFENAFKLFAMVAFQVLVILSRCYCDCLFGWWIHVVSFPAQVVAPGGPRLQPCSGSP